MTLRFEKRIRHLEASKNAIKQPDFNHASPDDVRNWKEILHAVMESGDESNYYDDLAAHAPTVYAAYLKAAK